MKMLEAIIADGVVYDVKETTEIGFLDCDFCDMWDGSHCHLSGSVGICPVPNNHHLKRREIK